MQRIEKNYLGVEFRIIHPIRAPQFVIAKKGRCRGVNNTLSSRGRWFTEVGGQNQMVYLWYEKLDQFSQVR